MIKTSFVVLKNISLESLIKEVSMELNEAFGSKVNIKHHKRIEELDLNHEDILHYKGFAYEQRDGYLIYIDNTATTYYSLFYCLAKKINTEIFNCSINEEKGYEGYYLTYYNGIDNQRTIYLIHDSNKWIFHQEGNIQSFEAPEYYKKKIKRNRFNKMILIEYLLKCNIDIDDHYFWTPKNRIIELRRET